MERVIVAAIEKHVGAPATDPGAVNPLPPAVRVMMAERWQRLLDGELPISEG